MRRSNQLPTPLTTGAARWFLCFSVLAVLLVATFPMPAPADSAQAGLNGVTSNSAQPGAAGITSNSAQSGNGGPTGASTSTSTSATPNAANAVTGAPTPPSSGPQGATTATTALAAPVTPFVPPTDQPSPEVPAPRALHLAPQALIDGAIDVRYRRSDSGRTNDAWVNEAEVDLAYPIVRHGVTNGNLVLQGIAENPPDPPAACDVQFGEAYVIYKLPINVDSDSTVFAKVGQFQIPFALLAVYDPHLLLSQPLYAESIGLRNDWGVDLSGRFYSVINYDFAITRGVGPSVIGQVDPTQVVTFRLGRTFKNRNGTVNVGGSLLQGRLPDTNIDAAHPYAYELPPSGRVYADQGYISKNRIAADATLLYKRLTARGEAMTGADNYNNVLGYYGIGEYKVTAHTSWLAARSCWYYPFGDSFSIDDQAGFTYSQTATVTWRALYEFLEDRPGNENVILGRKRFTVQMLFRF
ncbi:MAG: hypothetical protein ACLQVD_15010 [Capsulimonadaceae bacterium]